MNWQEYSIKEIDEYLQKSKVSEEMLSGLAVDKRIGARKLANKYQLIIEKEKKKEDHWNLLNRKVLELNKKGYKYIAGIDEAGRGPLAGPVVAAAVILDPAIKILGVDDSKKLTAEEREELYLLINKKAIAVGVGIVDNKEIDRLNILQATFKAMNTALGQLNIRPKYLLIDGNRRLPQTEILQETIIDGDSKVNAIAAASIIAKVTRDHLIMDYDSVYPEYGFAKNKGYGTKEHIQALKEFGPTPIHRFSFSIVNNYSFVHIKRRLLNTIDKEELYQLGKEIACYKYFSKENLQLLRKLYRDKHKKFVINE